MCFQTSLRSPLLLVFFRLKLGRWQTFAISSALSRELGGRAPPDYALFYRRQAASGQVALHLK